MSSLAPFTSGGRRAATAVKIHHHRISICWKAAIALYGGLCAVGAHLYLKWQDVWSRRSTMTAGLRQSTINELCNRKNGMSQVDAVEFTDALFQDFQKATVLLQ